MRTRETCRRRGFGPFIPVLVATSVMGVSVAVGLWNRSPATTVTTSAGSEPAASTTTVGPPSPETAPEAALPEWCEVDGVVTPDVPSLRPDDIADELKEAVRWRLGVEELVGDGGRPIDPDDPEAGLVTSRRHDSDVSPSRSPGGVLLVPLVVEPAQSDDDGVRFVGVSDGVATTILAITSSAGRVLTYAYEHSWDCPTAVRLGFDEVNEYGVTIFAELQTGEHVLTQVGSPWALDGNGDDVPIWYETDGSTLIQVVDARNAVAPIIFV